MRDVRTASWSAGTPPWRRTAWIALLVLLVAAGAWWLYARGPARAPAGRAGFNVPVPVVAAPVSTGSIDVTYNALGTVTPLATVTVRSQINGKIVEIPLAEGQPVKKGDLLAVIDPRPYELQLEQAEGQLAKDQALLTQAQQDLARYQILAKQDSIAAQTVSDQVHLVSQYVGQVKIDQSAIDTAKLNIAYCHIVAPIDGRAGLRQVDIGNYVTPNDSNGIVVLTQTQPITVLFSLPEDNLSSVMQRLSAGATLAVTALDRSNMTKLAAGKLTAVDSQIDPTTGTVKMRAQFDNANGALFPNQFVNVQLLVNTLTDATVIPTAAVQRGAPGTFVYVVKPDDTVAVQVVKLGPSKGERVAVTSGLTPGMQVVVDGADKLKENAKVVLRKESPSVPTQGGNAAPPGSEATPAAPNSRPPGGAS